MSCWYHGSSQKRTRLLKLGYLSVNLAYDATYFHVLFSVGSL